MPAYAHDTILELLALGPQAWAVVRELPAAAFTEAAS